MVTVMVAGSATAASSQQHRKEIMPFLGETREHFEARKRGLPRPAVTDGEAKLVPDRMGHFVAETTINGEKVRMLVDTGQASSPLARGTPSSSASDRRRRTSFTGCRQR